MDGNKLQILRVSIKVSLPHFEAKKSIGLVDRLGIKCWSIVSYVHDNAHSRYYTA